MGTITIDGQAVPFRKGQTIIEAATAAGVYIPHLCHSPEFKPHGSCKLCTVKVNGRNCASCTFPAEEGQEVVNNSEEMNAARRTITQMLFVEGNHVCPSCEKSGDCQLQAVAYFLGMLGPRFPHFSHRREVDASHPDFILDRDRCIQCELCVRASRDMDGKNVFALAGRGTATHLVVNTPSGKLGDSALAAEDKAANVCPVGAILPKSRAYETPIGERTFDLQNVSEFSLEWEQPVVEDKAHG
jgi:[NiFe] hydrogenase diaphorase moiety small subunit